MAKARKKPGTKQSASEGIYKRQDGETTLQYASRISRHEQNERDKSKPLVSPDVEKHGHYVWTDIAAIDAQGNDSKAATKRNTKASPLAYWKAQNALTAPQESAIAYCIDLWEFLPPLPRCTANYGEAIFGNTNGVESEAAINASLDAKDDLARICGGMNRSGVHVIGYIPQKYWRVFENCIRFDEPAGVAGSSLGYTGRSANAKALTVVAFVADLIAMKENL
jgi:hypothetical protein